MERRKSSTGKLRACLKCSIILPQNKFKTEGCPNCPFLSTGSGGNWQYCTSSAFTGQICLINPSKSWVSKWQRTNKCIPGYYAMIVDGDLSDDFIEKIEESGNYYFNRKESFKLE